MEIYSRDACSGRRPVSVALLGFFVEYPVEIDYSDNPILFRPTLHIF